MIIVADNEKNIFFTDKFFDIYINVSTKKIMASYTDTGRRQAILGEYDTLKKCERVFGFLLLALEDDKDIFRMPKNNDESLNTQLVQNGHSKKVHYENVGKTK
ncbi:hypothetical protein [Parvimonas micra]|jgi:hypothetical protein